MAGERMMSRAKRSAFPLTNHERAARETEEWVGVILDDGCGTWKWSWPSFGGSADAAVSRASTRSVAPPRPAFFPGDSSLSLLSQTQRPSSPLISRGLPHLPCPPQQQPTRPSQRRRRPRSRPPNRRRRRPTTRLRDLRRISIYLLVLPVIFSRSSLPLSRYLSRSARVGVGVSATPVGRMNARLPWLNHMAAVPLSSCVHRMGSRGRLGPSHSV